MIDLKIINAKYKEAVRGMKPDFFDKVSTDWYDYVIKLPIDQQIVYLIIVLRDQCFNGGFDQYFVNEYGQFATETIIYLREIGANSKSIALQKAYDIVNSEKYPPDVFRKLLLSNKITGLFTDDKLQDNLTGLDKEFENNDEDIEQLLINYLKRK